MAPAAGGERDPDVSALRVRLKPGQDARDNLVSLSRAACLHWLHAGSLYTCLNAVKSTCVEATLLGGPKNTSYPRTCFDLERPETIPIELRGESWAIEAFRIAADKKAGRR